MKTARSIPVADKIPKVRSAYTAPRALLATGVALPVVGLGVLSLIDEPTCADNLTQAQVTASGCVLGADMGPGLMILIVGPLAFSCIFVSLIWMESIYRRSPRANNDRW